MFTFDVLKMSVMYNGSVFESEPYMRRKALKLFPAVVSAELVGVSKF